MCCSSACDVRATFPDWGWVGDVAKTGFVAQAFPGGGVTGLGSADRGTDWKTENSAAHFLILVL